MNLVRVWISFWAAFFLGQMSVPAMAALPAGDLQFVNSCLTAFKKSSAPASDEISQRICQCTVKESHEQGVQPASLQREARRLAANPKYQIQDEALMNAFRFCTLQLMQEADQ